MSTCFEMFIKFMRDLRTSWMKSYCELSKRFLMECSFSFLFQTAFQWGIHGYQERSVGRIVKPLLITTLFSRSQSFHVLHVQVSLVTRIIYIIIRNLSVVSHQDLIALTVTIALNMYRMYVHTFAGNIPAMKYMLSMYVK